MIRLATVADVGWLIEAGERAQAESPVWSAFIANPGDQYLRVARMLRCPELVYIGVCADQSGFVCGSLEPTVWFAENLAVMSLVWVAPEKRGTWRAWRLIESFELWARPRASRVRLEVSESPGAALVARFCRKLGYVPMGQTFLKEL